MEKFPAGNAFGGFAAKDGAAERQKDLMGLVQSFCLCALIRGLQNLESPFEKGFNFVRAKSLLWWADLRFAEPRSFPERETVLFFSLVRKEPKVPQRFANLWTPGTIQISARYEIFADMTGVHQVTGGAGERNLFGYRR